MRPHASRNAAGAKDGDRLARVLAAGLSIGAGKREHGQITSGETTFKETKVAAVTVPEATIKVAVVADWKPPGLIFEPTNSGREVLVRRGGKPLTLNKAWVPYVDILSREEFPPHSYKNTSPEVPVSHHYIKLKHGVGAAAEMAGGKTTMYYLLREGLLLNFMLLDDGGKLQVIKNTSKDEGTILHGLAWGNNLTLEVKLDMFKMLLPRFEESILQTKNQRGETCIDNLVQKSGEDVEAIKSMFTGRMATSLQSEIKRMQSEIERMQSEILGKQEEIQKLPKMQLEEWLVEYLLGKFGHLSFTGLPSLALK